MRNRYEQLIKLLTSTGYTVSGFKGENDGFTIHLKMEVMSRPPHDFIERMRDEVTKIPYVVRLGNMSFNMGKKAENCSYLKLFFFLKHGSTPVNTNKIKGMILDFINKNNIENIHDFVKITCPMISDLNKHVKVHKPDNRRQIYSIKGQYIKFLHSVGYIESLYKQLSEVDELVLVNTKLNGVYFHVRHRDYIIKMTEEMPSDLPLYDKVYKPKTYTEKDIKNLELAQKYLPILLDGIYGNRKFILNALENKMKKITFEEFKKLWLEQETDNSDSKPQLVEEINESTSFKDLFTSLALWSNQPLEERINGFLLRNGYQLTEQDEESLIEL